MTEGAEVMVARFVVGEVGLEELVDSGFSIHSHGGEIRVELAAAFEPLVVTPRQLAEGLLAHVNHFQDLSQWARVVLGAHSLIVLSQDFERDPNASLLLEGVWDAAFGERPRPPSLTAAQCLAQEEP